MGTVNAAILDVSELLDRIQVWGPSRPVGEAGNMSWVRQKPAYRADRHSEAVVAHSVSMTLKSVASDQCEPAVIDNSTGYQWTSTRSGVLWQKLFMGALCEDWHTDWWRRRFRGCLEIQCFRKDTFMNVLWRSLRWNQQRSHLCSDFTNWTTALQLLLPVSWCNPHSLGSYAGTHNRLGTTLETSLDWRHLMWPL